jgi:hypothetical protein
MSNEWLGDAIAAGSQSTALYGRLSLAARVSVVRRRS